MPLSAWLCVRFANLMVISSDNQLSACRGTQVVIKTTTTMAMAIKVSKSTKVATPTRTIKTISTMTTAMMPAAVTPPKVPPKVPLVVTQARAITTNR